MSGKGSTRRPSSIPDEEVADAWDRIFSGSKEKETNMEKVQLHLGDCLATMRKLPDNSVDSIVTDPPYGLSFMGKKWDYDVPSVEIWAECLRVLKPGGHLLAFAGTRTQHRMAVRIEDAGFEIRDMIAWVYGSGFPKSLDVSKAIDKAAGAEREVVGFDEVAAKRTAAISTNTYGDYSGQSGDITAPATPEGKQWSGWGTALKPALEPITVARKPLNGTVAANVLAHGTGAINVGGCRVGDETRVNNRGGRRAGTVTGGSSVGGTSGGYNFGEGGPQTVSGRFPANFIHDGSTECTDLLQDAARFFYCAKASKKDRDAGMTAACGTQGAKGNGLGRVCETCGVSQLKPETCACETKSWVNPVRLNNHPTVKPTDLMRYLVRLVTPPGGTVLDPFMGSGSTGKACVLEGFAFIGCEMDQGYLKISRARITAAASSPPTPPAPHDGSCTPDTDPPSSAEPEQGPPDHPDLG